MPEHLEKSYSSCTNVVSRYAKSLANTNVGYYNHLRGISVINGHINALSPKLREYVEENVAVCRPREIHICDGTEGENKRLLRLMHQEGTIVPLPKYDNCWLARTDPRDVARVESKTFICTKDRQAAIPDRRPGVASKLGNWISPQDMDHAVRERFPNCMQGRTMYVVAFSMGPVGSPLSKIGVELTDSAYVAASMRIMTRIGSPVLALLSDNRDFVKALHSVGRPGNTSTPSQYPGWPCDPERTIVLHKPEENEIVSYGSGYGGNSLLGKKCFALRIGSTIARREGWLAEHMLILGITCSETGEKRYIVGAFPSACGKTNLAMLRPSLSGFKVECVGDDIAWMRFDATTGQLHAINPENGFFGVAPGTSMATNPNAMQTIFANTIFTNVASTSDGGVYWEGIDQKLDEGVTVTDWLGQPWDPATATTPAAHPNSRFCSPASQCPIIDSAWEDPQGVPIDAILFGGRRPVGVPLVYEAFDWQHGVFLGAAMKSEATAAAEHKGKVIMHDPFAMRPFFGYNFGHYLAHWLSMELVQNAKLPKIFHVNWFRKSEAGKFLWPGFGENVRVLEWILRRVAGEEGIAERSAIGLIPAPGSLRLDGMREFVDTSQLFSLNRAFWQKEEEEIRQYFNDQVGADLPIGIEAELDALRERVKTINA